MSQPRVLMCPPAHYTVRDVKNPFMQSARPVDPARALEQWNDLRDAFEAAGLRVLTIDPVEDLEDMVFTANQVFVGSGRAHERFIVPSRMRYASREREVPHFVRWFSSNGFDVLDPGLLDGDFLEGHGDLLRHPDRSHVWAGYGFRSSLGGVERFARAMEAEGIEVTSLELTDPSFYHLDTCFTALNADAVMIFPQAFSAEALDRIRAGWKRVHDVTREDALRFVCNGWPANGAFFVSHLPAALESIVRSEGLTPVVVDTSEFEKAGGSVFCMKMLLD